MSWRYNANCLNYFRDTTVCKNIVQSGENIVIVMPRDYIKFNL